MPRSPMKRLVAGVTIALLAVNAMFVTPILAKHDTGVSATPGCNLGNGVKHVVFIDFDNTHFARDIPNVPSDLEQMPHLLNFIKDNGTLIQKQYTILISHTAGGIISTLTGLYPDRNGITESNSYDYYKTDTTPTFSSAFKYWTSPVAAAPQDSLPNLITDGQQNAPAPWVTYTRAGCDVANFLGRQHRPREQLDGGRWRHRQRLRQHLTAGRRDCRPAHDRLRRRCHPLRPDTGQRVHQ